MEVSRTQLILRRGAAFVIDQVAVTLVYLILSLSLHWVLWLQPVSNMLALEQQRGLEPYMHSILFMAIGPLCFVVWEYLFNGKSPGKWVLGLVVINRAGGAPTLLQVLIRSATRYPEAALLFVTFLVCAESSRCQRIGDMLARTYVIPRKDLLQMRREITELPTTQP